MRRGHGEAGYALLFVYMMAAVVAIMLYTQLPRVAFEAQRDKEQLLIDRGEQYERGIQLYFRKFHQYPASLDALNNTQNIRFLRRRYVDPMTGKDDWRLIHVGAGGAFIDSVVNKGKSVQPTAPAEKQNFVNEISLVGSNTPDQNQPVNLAARRRASERPGAPGDPNNPAQGGPVDPNNPNAFANPANPANPGVPFNPANPAGAFNPAGQFVQGLNGPTRVLPDGRVVPVINGLPGGTAQIPPEQMQPGQMQPGQLQPGQPQPGQLQPGQVQPGIQPGVSDPNANPNNPASMGAQPNPYAQTGMPGQPGAPPAAAVNLINQMLTSPRPMPGQALGQTGDPNAPFGAQPGANQPGINQPGINQPGVTQPGVSQPGITQPGVTQPGAQPGGAFPANNTGTPITGTTGQTITGGIAGVASKAEGDGIKIYNDRSNYKEWEFIYDLSKDPTRSGAQQGQRLPGQQQPAGLNASPVSGANSFGSSTPGGSTAGSSAFGSTTSGTSTQQPPFGAQPGTTPNAPVTPAPTQPQQ